MQYIQTDKSAVHNVVSWREGCILTYQYYVHRMIYWLNLPTSFNQWLMHNWKCSTTTNTSALSVYSIILLWINYKQEHSESTNSTKAEISIESDLGFKSGIIQIRMFTRLLPKCSGFIAFLVLVILPSFVKNRPVTVWEMVRNLLKSLNPQRWIKWKSDPRLESWSPD